MIGRIRQDVDPFAFAEISRVYATIAYLAASGWMDYEKGKQQYEKPAQIFSGSTT